MFSRAVNRLILWFASPVGICAVLLVLTSDVAYGAAIQWASLWGNINGAATGILSMVFFVLVLHSDVRGTAALHLKLDQLILNDERMDNRLVASEDLSEVELRAMKEQAVAQIKDAQESECEP